MTQRKQAWAGLHLANVSSRLHKTDPHPGFLTERTHSRMTEVRESMCSTEVQLRTCIHRAKAQPRPGTGMVSQNSTPDTTTTASTSSLPNTSLHTPLFTLRIRSPSQGICQFLPLTCLVAVGGNSYPHSKEQPLHKQEGHGEAKQSQNRNSSINLHRLQHKVPVL